MIKYRKVSLQETLVLELQHISHQESQTEERRVTLTEIVRKALKAYRVQSQREV
jgi:hypothetical protein